MLTTKVSNTGGIEQIVTSGEVVSKHIFIISKSSSLTIRTQDVSSVFITLITVHDSRFILCNIEQMVTFAKFCKLP